MNLLNALTNSDTVEITANFDYRVETDIIGAGTVTGNSGTSVPLCISKSNSALGFSINTSAFNTASFKLDPHLIHFTGNPSGVDPAGNPIIIWTISENINPSISLSFGPWTINFSSIQGQVRTVIMPYIPVSTGMNCANAARTIVCFFENLDNDNNLVFITGDHGTVITLSNVVIFANVGLAPFLDATIIPHHNHKDDCNDFFNFIGEEVLFTSTVKSNPPGDNLTYSWASDVGAIPGNNTLPSVKVTMPDNPGLTAPGTIKIFLTVTDTDLGASQVFSLNMKYYPISWASFFYISCHLRILSQSIYRKHIPFDPGDPANRAIHQFLQSEKNLVNLLSQTKQLQHTIERYMDNENKPRLK